MSIWKNPPPIKIYEALGCIVDKRIVEESGEIRVYSSSRNKYYVIEYDEKKHAIVSNDNGSYYVGYLGYPAIAYLMLKEKISYNQSYAYALKDILWKDLNVKFDNDYFLVEEYIYKYYLKKHNINIKEFKLFVNQVLEEIKLLQLKKLQFLSPPPNQY
ncbi:MAG: hypothetical protein LAT82_00945 [Nanoarchaeota archaeon]|nr:hypothetical protein [Nanoarchaeota archaeon]